MPNPQQPPQIQTQIDVNDLFAKLLNAGIIAKKEEEKSADTTANITEVGKFI